MSPGLQSQDQLKGRPPKAGSAPPLAAARPPCPPCPLRPLRSTLQDVPKQQPSRPAVTSYSDALIRSSQRLRQRSLSPSSGSPIIRPPTNPNKSNVDYYRGHTKSIYEREPMFKDFARNIPLSQQNLLDSSNLTSLKNNFQSLVASRAGGQKPDPLRPLAIQTRNHRSASEALAEKHQRSRSSTPVVLPHIYVYHRTGRS